MASDVYGGDYYAGDEPTEPPEWWDEEDEDEDLEEFEEWEGDSEE